MGWSGYGLYDGDGTQTCHYNHIKWSGIKISEDDILEDGWLRIRKTKIPEEHLEGFIAGLPKVIKKMPKQRYESTFNDEDDAIEWQMLLSLCMDNNIKPPKRIYEMGIKATEFLSGEHAADFDYPGARRRVLKNFITKVKKIGYVQC